MEKVELEISAIIATATHFNLILREKYGTRRLPIIIGVVEGQVISWTLENIKLIRPLTHDLLISILDEYFIELKEVIINKFEDNIYHAVLVLEKDGEIKYIDSRASDAIALALKKQVPIYTTEEVLRVAAVDIEEFRKYGKKKDTLETKSLEELQRMLQEAIETENYELASKIRDEINRRKQQKKQ